MDHYPEHNFLRQSPEFEPDYRRHKTPWWMWALLAAVILTIWTSIAPGTVLITLGYIVGWTCAAVIFMFVTGPMTWAQRAVALAVIGVVLFGLK